MSGSREGWDSPGQQEPGAENFSRDSRPVVLSPAFRQEHGMAEDELGSVIERIPCRATLPSINLKLVEIFSHR